MAGMCGCCDMMSQWWHGRDYTVTRWAEQAGTTLWEVARRDAGPRSQPTLHSSQPRHSDTQWKYNQSSDDVKPSNTEKTKANTCASHLASKDYFKSKTIFTWWVDKIISSNGDSKIFCLGVQCKIFWSCSVSIKFTPYVATTDIVHGPTLDTQQQALQIYLQHICNVSPAGLVTSHLHSANKDHCTVSKSNMIKHVQSWKY